MPESVGLAHWGLLKGMHYSESLKSCVPNHSKTVLIHPLCRSLLTVLVFHGLFLPQFSQRPLLTLGWKRAGIHLEDVRPPHRHLHFLFGGNRFRRHFKRDRDRSHSRTFAPLRPGGTILAEREIQYR